MGWRHLLKGKEKERPNSYFKTYCQTRGTCCHCCRGRWQGISIEKVKNKALEKVYVQRRNRANGPRVF